MTEPVAQWTLTDEHKARIPEWNERWAKVMDCTDPIDFHRSAEAIGNLYDAAGRPRPRFLYAPSPFVGIHMMAAIAALDPPFRTPTTNLERMVFAGADDKPFVGEEWDDQFGTLPQQSVDIARERCTALNPNSDRYNAVIQNWASYYNGGSEWASWCCYLSFVRDVVGWKHESQAEFAHYEEACLYGGPRFMSWHCVILCDRYSSKHLDENRAQHCETGPSMSWRCGAKTWHINGVEVNEQVVLRPETQSIDDIKKETNEEVRRVRIDRYGWLRYLAESGATVVDTRRNDRDAQDETLYRLDDGSQRFVCIDPSTGRKYAIGVPRDIVACQDAQNWMSHGADAIAIHRS